MNSNASFWAIMILIGVSAVGTFLAIGACFTQGFLSGVLATLTVVWILGFVLAIRFI